MIRVSLKFERAERREKADRELTRRLLDLGRAHNRSVNELGIQQSRQREDLARQAAAKAVEIAERAASELSGIAQQQTEARTQATIRESRMPNLRRGSRSETHKRTMFRH